MSEETYKTFDEWNNEGYRILKGAKAKYCDGVPKFSREQVIKFRPNTVNNRHWTCDFDHDDTIEYGILEHF